MSQLSAVALTALALGLALSVPGMPAAEAQQPRGNHATAPRARGGFAPGPHVTHIAPRPYPQYGAGPRYHRRGGVGAGVAAGVAGAIILNEFARPRYYYPSYGYGYYGGGYYDGPAYYGSRYYDDAPFTCRELRDRCWAGDDWACQQFDVNLSC